MKSLFNQTKSTKPDKDEIYDASAIEVLEGLEPVRKRPAMYIGGTDQAAYHHLAVEVLDNSFDEAVAGYANKIWVYLRADGFLEIADNGRGIPVDPHPKFPDKSALEVILTTLHSGGKFSQKAYKTSGGLHGVGVSVVNALSDMLIVEVIREKKLYRHSYVRGEPLTALEVFDDKSRQKSGTKVIFHPDPEIFGKGYFSPKTLYKIVRAKAFLYGGVVIYWKCDADLISDENDVPAEETINFPNGLADYLEENSKSLNIITSTPFIGKGNLAIDGHIEWGINFAYEADPHIVSYCNTILTPQGGTHENGFKSALVKSLKKYGERVGNKKASQIIADDVFSSVICIISLFIPNPEFQGQTKEKLVNDGVQKAVDSAIGDHFDHFLSDKPKDAEALLNYIITKLDERNERKQAKDVSRKTAIDRICLPGKLTDCSRKIPKGTELFIVEGDSAGGSAKQARNREIQAILPLRGKILNIASASADKFKNNQALSDLEQALGAGSGKTFRLEKLRYERIIIMTDADVDGAHIASLLMTYFYLQMPELIHRGHLYLAKPPLFRIVHGTKIYYADDDQEKDQIVSKIKGNVQINRFKGLGEMTAAQLKETGMDPKTRSMYKVVLEAGETEAGQKVENIMGKNPEMRFKFIQEQALNNGEALQDSIDA